MTSFRQIESNRRNALKSTGPKTEDGKQRASRNAVRHGLTAETVIIPLEDPEDYKAFEQSVTADYEAQTAVERELVLRLASLLWRLRRATSIETGLLQIQADILRELRDIRQTHTSRAQAVNAVHRFDQPATHFRYENPKLEERHGDTTRCEDAVSATRPASQPHETRLDIARCFLRLANLDNGVFERLGRYETALWRQGKQTIFALERLLL